MMGLIGEMRAVPQSWDEYLYGLLARPLEAIGEWGTENQTPVTGGWQAPFEVIADAAPFMARGLGEWGGQLREASEGMPLTSDAGGFPPDSPLSFLNQRVNNRGAAVLDAWTGLIGPGAQRVGKAAGEVARAIPDIAMDAYGPQRSASWLIGGERAQTADKVLLEAAKRMEADVPGSIDAWQNTNWYNDPVDYRWKFEIPDDNARVKMRQVIDDQVAQKTEKWAQYDDAAYLRGYVARGEAPDTAAARERFMKVFKREPQPGAFQLADNNDFEYLLNKSRALEADIQYKNQVWRGRLSDVLDHPEAYAAYPDLADVPVTVLPRDRLGGSGGWWSDSTGITLPNDLQFNDETLRTLLHEMQHGIQSIEDFSQGGHWQGLEGLLANDLRSWSADHRAAREAGDDELARRLFSQWQLAEEGQALAFDDPMRAYFKLAGEAEARLAEHRMNFSPEDRRLIHPLDSLADMMHDERSGLINERIPRPALGASTPLPRVNAAPATGLIGGAPADVRPIAPPKRGWKFGDPIEGDFDAPKLIDDLMQGRPLSREALTQFEEGAKKAGNPAEWIEKGKQRLMDVGEEASAAAHAAASDSSQVHDFVDDVVVRIGVLNTPALSGERFNRVRAVMDAIERGDISVEVPKLGSMMPGEMVKIDIPKEIRGKKVREFYNVPINDPILRKPKPPDFNYPIVVTGNPHLTNFIRPDPSWDEVIKTVRVKPVFQGNEKVDNAIAKAINYAHEVGARPLVTTFRDNSLWRLSHYTDLLPTDPKAPAFAKYWKKNPDPPPADKNLRPHYNEYQPTEAAKRAFRDAGWDTAKKIAEVHATGSEWYPRSRELSDGILSKVKDKEGPVEYCDALGAGCTSCRNCAKTTQSKESHQSPIVGCTDEPWCSNACPGCFVPRATKGNTKGRQKIGLGTNVKQGGYGQADLGDTYKGTVNVLQGVMRKQDAPVNYAARFMTLDPTGQADMAVSLYTSGLIGKPEYQTMLKEIRGAAGIIGH